MGNSKNSLRHVPPFSYAVRLLMEIQGRCMMSISHNCNIPGRGGTTHPGSLLPSGYLQEDDRAWETTPLGCFPSGSNIYILPYISIVLLANWKSACAKMYEIKIKKILAPRGHRTRTIPLNAASSRQELSKICSIFGLGRGEHCRDRKSRSIPLKSAVTWQHLFPQDENQAYFAQFSSTRGCV